MKLDLKNKKVIIEAFIIYNIDFKLIRSFYKKETVSLETGEP